MFRALLWVSIRDLLNACSRLKSAGFGISYLRDRLSVELQS
jgi:hypothetical protein